MTAMHRAAIAILVAIGLSIPAAAAAQETEKGRLEWIQDRLGAGFYGGISFAAFNGVDIEDSPDVTHAAKTSPTVGGFMTLSLSERWDIQGEVAVATKGASLTDANNIRATTNLVYLEFPVLAKVKASSEWFGVYGFGGFAVAALFDGRTEDEFGTVIDVRPDIHSVDAGFLIGAGASIGSPGDQSVFFELRYEVGLRNLDPTGVVDSHNSVFSILAGLAM